MTTTMIEYFGWVTYRLDTGDGGDVTKAGAARLSAQLESLRGCVQITHGWINGELRFALMGAANHRDDFERVSDLFRAIGVEAPGSYGLLSVHDDEDPNHHNEFVTWALARGRLAPHVDVLLSPVVPTIED